MEKTIQYNSVSAYRIIFSSFLNQKFLFAFKMLFEEIKMFVFGLAHMHTDVNVVVFFHAYWKRSLKILKLFQTRKQKMLPAVR